jgi:hypothetical protein
MEAPKENIFISKACCVPFKREISSKIEVYPHRRHSISKTCRLKEIICYVYIINIYISISGSLSPRHGAFSGCGWRNGLRIWTVSENTLNKQSRAADKGWPSSLGVGRGANNSSP